MDLGYKYESLSKFHLTFAIWGKQWVGYVDEDTFINLSEQQLKSLVKATGKRFPKPPEISWWDTISGWIVLFIGVLLFQINNLYEKIKYFLGKKERDRIEKEIRIKKDKEKQHIIPQLQKLEKTKYIRASAYTKLMCKSFNTSSRLPINILNALEKSNSSDINLKINVKNNLSKEISTTVQNLHKNYTGFETAHNYFTYEKTHSREKFLSSQLESTFATIYGDEPNYTNGSFYSHTFNSILTDAEMEELEKKYKNPICKMTRDNQNAAIQIDITYTVSDYVIGNDRKKTEIGIMLPKISWEVNIFHQQKELLAEYKIETAGIIVPTVSYKDLNDLFEKIAKLHIGTFTNDLLLKLGLNIDALQVNKYSDVVLDQNIFQQFKELQIKAKYTDEQLNKMMLDYYNKNTTPKERFNNLIDK